MASLSQAHFDCLFTAFSTVSHHRPEVAARLTAILRAMLDRLNDLPCRVVKTYKDSMAVVSDLYEAVLQGAKQAEPFCLTESVETKLMLSQAMYGALQIIQLHCEWGGDRGRQPWSLKADYDAARRRAADLTLKYKQLREEGRETDYIDLSRKRSEESQATGDRVQS